MLDTAESDILAQARLDDAWDLVTTFSGMHRWRPEDVNRAGDLIAERLGALGLPVTVHRPKLFLSVPIDASVEAGGETFRAKPPSSAASRPDGVTAELVYLPAEKSSLRSYNKKAAAFFGEAIGTDDEMREKLEGKILLDRGIRQPRPHRHRRGMGRRGADRHEPRRRHPLGHLHHGLGQPRPRRYRPQAIDPRRRGQQGDRRQADRDRPGRRPRHDPHHDGGRLVRAGDPGRRDPRHAEPTISSCCTAITIPGTWAWATTPPATPPCSNARGCCGRTARASPGRSASPGGPATPPAATPVRPGSPTPSRIDLDENCVMQINCDSPGCRWATSYHQTTAMAETFDLVSRRHRGGRGPDAAVPAPAPGRRLFLQQHRDIELLHAELDDA